MHAARTAVSSEDIRIGKPRGVLRSSPRRDSKCKDTPHIRLKKTGTTGSWGSLVEKMAFAGKWLLLENGRFRKPPCSCKEYRRVLIGSKVVLPILRCWDNGTQIESIAGGLCSHLPCMNQPRDEI